jgi:phosphatidylglycerol:prolipoprotein diacylglycerol transferase
MTYDAWFPHLGIKIEHLSRVAFAPFGFNIYWYGVIITAAIVAGMYMVSREAFKTGQNADDYLNFAVIAIIAGVIGARAYYVLFRFGYYRQNLGEILAVRDGGLAVYGGIIAAVVAAAIFCRKRGISFGLLFDTFTPSLLLGQILGRFGNFFNREAFGGYTDGLFAMRYPASSVPNAPESVLSRLVEAGGTSYIQVHPTFLYESACNLALLIFILIFRRKKRFNGQIACVYFIGYGAARFFIESLRTDSLLLPFTQIPVSMVVSALIFLVGFTIIIRNRKVAREGK